MGSFVDLLWFEHVYIKREKSDMQRWSRGGPTCVYGSRHGLQHATGGGGMNISMVWRSYNFLFLFLPALSKFAEWISVCLWFFALFFFYHTYRAAIRPYSFRSLKRIKHKILKNRTTCSDFRRHYLHNIIFHWGRCYRCNGSRAAAPALTLKIAIYSILVYLLLHQIGRCMTRCLMVLVFQ